MPPKRKYSKALKPESTASQSNLVDPFSDCSIASLLPRTLGSHMSKDEMAKSDYQTTMSLLFKSLMQKNPTELVENAKLVINSSCSSIPNAGPEKGDNISAKRTFGGQIELQGKRARQRRPGLKGKEKVVSVVEPSSEQLSAAVSEILKEADFNVTPADIIKLLGACFDTDLMHRKVEIKHLLKEVIDNMANVQKDDDDSGGTKEDANENQITSTITMSRFAVKFSSNARVSKVEFRFLFEKELKKSDLNSLGRIVVPKEKALIDLPKLDRRNCIPLVMHDFDENFIPWEFIYRFWCNRKGKMFILENTGEFVKSHDLQLGDFIIFYKNDDKNEYVIRGRKDNKELR